MSRQSVLDPEEEKLLKAYRRRLYLLMGISSGIDFFLTGAEALLLIPSWGTSILVEEMVEWVISSLLAKNKMELKNRYKIVGLIPLPGVTSLTVQALIELRKARKEPRKVLQKLES